MYIKYLILKKDCTFAVRFERRCFLVMIIINVKENESIDKALKRFKKKFERTGVLKELRSRQAYEKPSVSKRTEKIKAAYKQKMYANDNY